MNERNDPAPPGKAEPVGQDGPTSQSDAFDSTKMGIGIALGLAIGIMIWVVTGQVAFLGTGVAFGVAIGAAFARQGS